MSSSTNGIVGIVIAVALMTASCRHPAEVAKEAEPVRSGEVNSGMILPEDSMRMQLGANQVFVSGEQTNPEVVPIYPPESLPLRLPDQVVCVKFVVNPNGSVSNAMPTYGAKDCPAESEPPRSEFLAATLDAVSQWDFFSFQRCTFPAGTPPKKQCNGAGTTVEQVAVTLAYRFVFSAKDGAGSVSRAAANQAP